MLQPAVEGAALVLTYPNAEQTDRPRRGEDIMSIPLYTWPTPNGHKVQIMLEELAAPYEVHPIDITRWYGTVRARPAVERGLNVLLDRWKSVPDTPGARENLFGDVQFKTRS